MDKIFSIIKGLYKNWAFYIALVLWLLKGNQSLYMLIFTLVVIFYSLLIVAVSFKDIAFSIFCSISEKELLEMQRASYIPNFIVFLLFLMSHAYILAFAHLISYFITRYHLENYCRGKL